GCATSFKNKLKNGPVPDPSIPGGYIGSAANPIVRFVTAVPAGTGVKSPDPAPLNQITFRAFVTATSALNTVPSCIRYSASTVPSRSLTAIVIFVFDPCGNRITARVVSAVATAWLTMVDTSSCVRLAPALGPTRYPSGGNPPATGPVT